MASGTDWFPEYFDGALSRSRSFGVRVGWAWGFLVGFVAALIFVGLTGCTVQGGTKKGGGWQVDWQPPKVEIQNGEGRPLLIDFGRVLWTDWPAPEAAPVEPGPAKT